MSCTGQFIYCVLLYVPNQKQARRVYEILRLKATDRSNAEEYKAYRLSVKNRMNGPYQVRVLLIILLNLGMSLINQACVWYGFMDTV